MSESRGVTDVGHLLAHTSPSSPAVISIQPLGAQDIQGEERRTDLIDDQYRLPSPYPESPTPFNDRVPLPYDAQGYVHVAPHYDQTSWRPTSAWFPIGEGEELTNEIIVEQEQASPTGDFVSHGDFQKIVEGFKSEDGKFLAMTAYGAVPLPEQMLQTIPERFVTKPLIQEREVFVLKQEHQTRITERDYTQFDHQFVTVPKSITVDKVKTVDIVKIIEIPHFRYKPVVEDKVVEIPYGIKYVEVPIEVRCKMPPRIIPVPKPHIVERIIETTKPVVQEKIIEVPEIIKKNVPRVVIKEIPYVVPKYVEKIIEVPYKPGEQLPTPQGAPMSLIPKPPPLYESERGYSESIAQGKFRPAEARIGYAPSPPAGPVKASGASETAGTAATGRIEGSTLIVDEEPVKGPQTFYLSQGIKHIKLPYEARIDVTLVQEDEVPEGAPIAQSGVRYMAPGPKAIAYGDFSPKEPKKPLDPVYAGPMDAIIEHAAPGMRAIEFRTKSDEPDILTQQGVLKYSKFECCLKKDVEKLLPILPDHNLVPMDPPGVPSWKELAALNLQYSQRIGKEFADANDGRINVRSDCFL